MGNITVSLEKSVYSPGEDVSGTVHASLDKPISQRSAMAFLIGKERTSVSYTVTVHSGKHTSVQRRTAVEESEFLHEGFKLSLPIDENGKLKPGDYSIPFKFTLPQGLPGTYVGQHARITYQVEAKVDVPLGFDVRESSEFDVVPVRRAFSREPIDACSDNWNDPTSAGLNLMLDSCVYGRGEALSGRCAFRNPDSKSLRKVVVSLKWIERAIAQGHEATADLGEQVAEIPIEGKVLKGENPFTIRISQYAPLTYESTLSSVRCAIKAKLDIAWAGDVAANDTIIVDGATAGGRMPPPYYPEAEVAAGKVAQEKEYRPGFEGRRPVSQFCSHCGAAIRNQDASYCSDCGSRLKARAASVTQVTTQPQTKLRRRVPPGAAGVENCIVCRGVLSQDDDVVWCPHCGRLAHREHMMEWVHGKKSCPACGKSLDEDYYD